MGLVLATLLIGGLFEIQRQFTLMQNKVEQAGQIVFERQRLYSRLNPLFKHCENFWLEDDGLALKYTEDLDHDRNFRGECLSFLHRDENNLILTTYAKTQKQEILLKLDKKAVLQFSVFDMEATKWVDTWPSDLIKKNLSDFGHCMLKLSLKTPKKGGKEEAIEFPFWITKPT